MMAPTIAASSRLRKLLRCFSQMPYASSRTRRRTSTFTKAYGGTALCANTERKQGRQTRLLLMSMLP